MDPRPAAWKWPLLALAAIAIGCAQTSEPRTATPSDEAAAPPVVEPAAWTEEDRAESLASFDQVWETIRDRHYDPNLNGVDWDAARAELRPKVENAQSRSEVRSVIYDLFSRLGESHYGIVPSRAYDSVEADEEEFAVDPEVSEPASDDVASSDTSTTRDESTTDEPDVPTTDGDKEKEDDEADEAVEGRSGIIVRLVDGEAVVVEAADPAARAGVKRGWAITQIGSRTIANLFEALDSDDPRQDRLLKEAAVLNRLQGDAGDELSIEFDSPSGPQQLDIVLAPVEGVPVRTGFMPALTLEFDEETRESGVGYFRFNLFIDPNRLKPAFDEAMVRFMESNAPGVIIDLRGNPGGIGILATAMSGWFFEESGRNLGTMKMRSGDLRFVVFPQPDPYRGKLAVLIDGQSGSTSEIMAAGLQDLGRARVFGLRSAGAALPSVFEKLPNGDGFQYAIADFLRPNGERVEGKGVEPDAKIEYDREILLSGRDPMIDAAERWILDASND